MRLPAWRKILSIGLPIFEACLLALGFPYLVASMTATNFVLKTALLWWTDLIGLFLLLSVLLLIKSIARLGILLGFYGKSRGHSSQLEAAEYGTH